MYCMRQEYSSYCSRCQDNEDCRYSSTHGGIHVSAALISGNDAPVPFVYKSGWV